MRDRVCDWSILLTVSAALTLPNLGVTSLWDVDEAVNAQAAREMRDADTWVIPTFNYQLRTAKPVMLYWLQRLSYAVFGVSEWSARLPSVLAGWASVLLTYELARRMFDRGTARLAGLVLTSVIQFGVLSHAATPDATLLMFTLFALLAFWVGHTSDSRAYWVVTAVACGLAVLTKGPVGVVLPAGVITVYFAANRELGRLLDRRLLVAGLAFLLVAGPWYGLVSSETRGEWVKAFLGHDNVRRFLRPLEGHRGPLWYYPVAILVLFAPWTAFLGAAVVYGVRGMRQHGSECGPTAPGGEHGATAPGGECVPTAPGVVRGPRTHGSLGVGAKPGVEVRAYRFLVTWVSVYLLFFTAAATKLPNYVYPLYPALAILTARFLTAWCAGRVVVPRWVMPAGIATMAGVGVVVLTGALYADGRFPGLKPWAALGFIPLAGAAVMAWCLRAGNRGGLVTTAAVASIAFVGLVVAGPPQVFERQKPTRDLVQASGAADPDRDARVATFRWFQPSVVFYTGRQVQELANAAAVAEFLEVPTPAYLFVAARAWEEIGPGLPVGLRVVARRFDFLKNCDVLVVTNVPGPASARVASP